MRGRFGPRTPFQRPQSGGYRAPLTVRFPVENQQGIEAISSLDIGESTLVHVGLTNISRAELGERRKLQVRLWVHDEQLTSKDFFFRTTEWIDNQGVAEETPLAYPGRMWTHENWSLEPGETRKLKPSFRDLHCDSL